MHTIASCNTFLSTELVTLESYTKAARRPYRSDPMGMLVMRILWLIPALLGPNSSDVMETAAENTNPELNPIIAVLACKTTSLPDTASKKKAIGVGTKATASHPVLAKFTLLHF